MSVVITRTVAAEGDGLAPVRRALRFSGAEIERAKGLPRGVISAVERGRLYAYPRFRALVTEFFSAETGEPFLEVHDRLFPEYDPPEMRVPAFGGQQGTRETNDLERLYQPQPPA